MPAPAAPNPFLCAKTDCPLVALRGARNGYLMIAPRQEIVQYAQLPPAFFTAAHAWAAQLEQLGSPRVYWITLSEVTRHLHSHIFPRWPEDSLKGIPLFESRDSAPQPAWTPELEAALHQWAMQHSVELLN